MHMNSNKFSRLSPESPSARARPPTQEQIGALANAIWMDRGCPEGRDMDHWLEAERQLGGGSGRLPSTRKELPVSETSLDPQLAKAGRIERALDRAAPTLGQRSPTSL